MCKYVAVNVNVADMNTADMVDLVPEKLDETVSGVEFIASISHHFSLEVPNRTH